MRSMGGALLAVTLLGVVGLVACGLDVIGTLRDPSIDAGPDGDGARLPDGAPLDAGLDGEITLDGTASDGASTVSFLGTSMGMSSSGEMTVASDVVPLTGDLFIAALSYKSNEMVTGVTGLGVAWTLVATQCGGRDQTGVSVWRPIGAPIVAGPVMATFNNAPESAVIVVSRYAGAHAIGAVVSANTVGIDAGCSGGTDGTAFSVAVPSAPGALVFGAVALRSRDLTPGAGCIERAELHFGSSGNVAGLGILEAQLSPVSGTLSSAEDWAVAAFTLLP